MNDSFFGSYNSELTVADILAVIPKGKDNAITVNYIAEIYNAKYNLQETLG